MSTVKPAGLSVFTLVMLIVGAIDSIRNLPATALFGSSLIFFFIFSAIIFLIPVACISAELSSNWDNRSGVFHWIKLALGEKAAFVAMWSQWISNIVWFPAILSFIASTLSYLIDPTLGENKFFLVSIILITFLALTFFNLKGIQTSAKFARLCTIIGLIIPIALIMALAFIWMILGKPLQIHFTLHNLIPTFHDKNNWVSLTAIMTAFLGVELTTVHIKDVKNPKANFPKALGIAVLLILATMILGSLAIAVVLPKNEINLVNGVMQAFANFFSAYHMSWLTPLLAVMLFIGSLGGIMSWVNSLAKGLLQTAQCGFMPEILRKENKYGAASHLLILQAVLVSLFCLAFLFMPSVNGSYWLLTATSTQIYIVLYSLLFITGLYLRYKFTAQYKNFVIPGGKWGLWLICILGLIGCIITIIVGFIPPSGINVGTLGHYEMIFCGGIILMLAPICFFCTYKNRTLSLRILSDKKLNP